MRITLEVDDDLIAIAKQIARDQGKTAGEVIAGLLRDALAAKEPALLRNGVRVYPHRYTDPRSDLELVNELRDEM